MSLPVPVATDFKKRDLRTHVYLEPDNYICSDAKMPREEWVYQAASKKIEAHSIEFPHGCERIFLEILSNACDNVNRSRRSNIDPGTIEVTMDHRLISVVNHGSPIPVTVHP